MKQKSNVFVAGIGTINAIGLSASECMDALKSARDGISEMSYLDTVHKKEIPAAEVKLDNNALSRLSGMKASASRAAHISYIAAKEALKDAQIDDLQNIRKGFVSANTIGGLDRSELFLKAHFSKQPKAKLQDIVQHECGTVTEMVADALQLKDFITTISTACSSSANAIMLGARLIKHDILDVAVCGGTDALTLFTLNGFNSLFILDREKCKPFDEYRNGLNLGEGAGYIVLVSESIASKLPKTYCRLSGYANANDAYHQTASSPDGIGNYMAMKGALEMAALSPQDIDYINLHGTGTQNNDLSEGTAIERLFFDKTPMISSTKSFTGHTLGASGGVEAVFSVMSLHHNCVFPNLRFKHKIDTLHIMPETALKEVKLHHVLSNSFGFGGNCSALIFSK